MKDERRSGRSSMLPLSPIATPERDLGSNVSDTTTAIQHKVYSDVSKLNPSTLSRTITIRRKSRYSTWNDAEEG